MVFHRQGPRESWFACAQSLSEGAELSPSQLLLNASLLVRRVDPAAQADLGRQVRERLGGGRERPEG